VIETPEKAPPPPKWWTRPPLIGAYVAAALLVATLSWYIHRTCCSPPPVAPSADKPLITAITQGKTDDVNKLLSAQTANQANPDGMTPLLAAIQYGKPEIVKALLAKGANINAARPDGTTPLMLASEGTGYLPDNLPLVEALIPHNPNLEARDSSGQTALHRAVKQGKIDVVRLLLDHGAQIDAKTSDGSTPLFYAAEFGKVPILELLIERHAALDQPNASGDTPLMIASEGNGYLPNNGPMVEALLAAGARVDTADAQGRSSLYRAAAQGKEDAMRLLLDHQANVNLRANDRTTPLFAAVTNDRLGAAQLLLEHNADLKLSNADDINPLMVAAETSATIKNPADFIKLLLDHGAKKTATDARGRTALQHAIDSKNQAAIDLLK
jgi:ankyrin repeat protein